MPTEVLVQMGDSEATAQKLGAQDSPEGDPGKRERSTIEFPYLDLDDAVEVAKGVHSVSGDSCQWDQLAAQLNQAAKGGGFRQRVMTAKLFGFLTYDRGTVTLTASGSRVCDPAQEKAARVEGFLAIQLYKAIYEKFKGVNLPPTPAALEALMVTLGVAQKQKDKARQVFQRSAQQAGFFQYGTSKLVMPNVKLSSRPADVPNSDMDDGDGRAEKRKGGDEPPPPKRHPLIEGLLNELPEPKSEWTTEDRKKWLEMASTIFNVIYKDSDDSRASLRVVVEKNSVMK